MSKNNSSTISHLDSEIEMLEKKIQKEKNSNEILKLQILKKEIVLEQIKTRQQ